MCIPEIYQIHGFYVANIYRTLNFVGMLQLSSFIEAIKWKLYFILWIISLKFNLITQLILVYFHFKYYFVSFMTMTVICFISIYLFEVYVQAERLHDPCSFMSDIYISVVSFSLIIGNNLKYIYFLIYITFIMP